MPIDNSQTPPTNISGNQTVPVFKCPVFRRLLYYINFLCYRCPYIGPRSKSVRNTCFKSVPNKKTLPSQLTFGIILKALKNWLIKEGANKKFAECVWTFLVPIKGTHIRHILVSVFDAIWDKFSSSHFKYDSRNRLMTTRTFPIFWTNQKLNLQMRW
jgi:hypothetical protein